MKKKSIAIIAGGDSSEYEISINGASFYKSFLSKEKYDSTIVIISKKGWYAISKENKYQIDKNDFSYIENGKKKQFDIAIIIIHGTPGENGLVQAYFDLIGMPYTSGGFVSSAISFDKEFSKAVVKEYGVKVADGFILHKLDEYSVENIAKIGFPMFIKPNASGSSFGVSKVNVIEEIEQAIKHAFTEDDVILIEKGIIGKEISCGAYCINGEIVTLPPTEIITDRDFFDFEAKYKGESNEITPANISNEVHQKLNNCTKKIYKALRCRSIVRIDYIIENNEPYFIEINNIPGMSKESIIPQQVKAACIDIDKLYDDIINEFSK